MQNRYLSLDIFRGMTIAMMILVNNPGSWSYVYPPFLHAPWHGCTPTDLVFPFFLFIVGVAMRFSFKKFNYQPSSEALKKLFWRTISIFAIGTFLHAFPFIRQDWDWSGFRIMGVLQRIALCYGLAGVLILYLSEKKLLIASCVILIGYWLLLWLGGGEHPYALETNLPRQVDSWLLGASHLYKGTGIPFDPEGLLSTLPAMVTVLIGYGMGIFIPKMGATPALFKKAIISGLALLLLGWLWGFVFPINKQLWTSSYVLLSGGWAVLVLTLCVWIIDAKGFQKWGWFFKVYGMNALFVFMLSGLWVKTIIRLSFTLNGKSVNGYAYLYETVFKPFAGNYNGSLLFAIAHVLGIWLIAWWMYRQKLFVKV